MDRIALDAQTRHGSVVSKAFLHPGDRMYGPKVVAAAYPDGVILVVCGWGYDDHVDLLEKAEKEYGRKEEDRVDWGGGRYLYDEGEWKNTGEKSTTLGGRGLSTQLVEAVEEYLNDRREDFLVAQAAESSSSE